MPLSEEVRATIDAMPKIEIIGELGKGPRSRFQGDRFDYLKKRLAEIEEAENKEHQEQRQTEHLQNRIVCRSYHSSSQSLP